MRLLDGGKVWLEAGEVIPVACRCGATYQPERGSQRSTCPACQRVNFHGEMPEFSLLATDPPEL